MTSQSRVFDQNHQMHVYSRRETPRGLWRPMRQCGAIWTCFGQCDPDSSDERTLLSPRLERCLYPSLAVTVSFVACEDSCPKSSGWAGREANLGILWTRKLCLFGESIFAPS
jgi:hypothetical protein